MTPEQMIEALNKGWKEWVRLGMRTSKEHRHTFAVGFSSGLFTAGAILHSPQITRAVAEWVASR